MRLRSGNVRRAYFAHEAGLASPDCEDYHPGIDFEGTIGRRSNAPSVQPLALYFVPDVIATVGHDAWHLELLVPRAPDAVGWVYVPAGRAGEVPVSCSRLENHGRRIPVRLLADAPYLLRVSSSIDAGFAKRLSVGAPGFSSDVISAFRYSETGGRRLRESSSLYWGRGYYLIWHSTFRVQWPRTLWRQTMREVGPWIAARVELPVDEDDAVSEWASTYLDRDIERPPVSMSLVYPPSAVRLEDETWLVPRTDTILIGLTGEHGAETPNTLRLESETNSDPRQLRLPDRLPLLVNVLEVSDGITRLSLDDDEETELVVQQAVEPSGALVAAPSLVLADSDREYVVPVHSDAAEASLADSYAGTRVLIRFELAPITTARLRRRANSATWTDLTFACEAEALRASPEQARKAMYEQLLKSVLEAVSSNAEIELDFGNFGRLAVRPRMAPAPASPRAIRLTTGLRSRIAWLTPLLGGNADGLLASEDRGLAGITKALLNGEISSNADRAMLVRLHGAQRRPPHLLPHIADLAIQLRQLMESVT